MVVGNVDILAYLEKISMLSVLAGLLAVDERAGWQGMFAHPVVSSAIVGLLLGDFATAVSVGVVLELVWLSILPMRGMRRPDAVAGAVVGAGTAVLIFRHTGDSRVEYIVALSAVFGLTAGELAGSLGRRIHRARERRLGRFDPPVDGRALRRRLVQHFYYSVFFTAGAEVLVVAVMLPASVLAADWVTGSAGDAVVTGSRRWLDLVPVLGAGALIQMYWHKQHNRYLILSAAVVLMVLWIL